MGKTKPHGWTYECNPIAKLQGGEWVRLFYDDHIDENPWCLIKPDVMDRIREFLDGIVHGLCDTRERQQERAAELLKLLPGEE